VGGSLWLTRKITEPIVASIQTIHEGSALACEAGKTMSDVMQASARVTDIMGDVAAAWAAQNRGIEQVNPTIRCVRYLPSPPSASRCAHGLRRAAQFPVPPSECTQRRASRRMRGPLDLGHALLNQPNDEYPKKALHVRTANRVP